MAQAAAAFIVTPDAKPANELELEACLRDPMWRLSNLYKIIVKSEGEDGDGHVVLFKPNRAQRRFLSRLWHRNVILKARQLGFTTLICLAWLDYCLFTPNVRCGIIAQDLEAAGVIFRDKVKFAYEHLPDEIREAMPLRASNATEMVFHNNSSIRVATSMRSGTIHRLHVSEFGKICAKYPDKAAEVMTGSIPAVPLDGVLVIESTAEGKEGEFYKITERAGRQADEGVTLTQRDYRLHFFPWHEEVGYAMDPAGVVLTAKDREYFDQIESKIGRKIHPEQRAWYVATRDADFPSNPERMWQEYPSTREEAFQVSSEGVVFARQMSAMRLSGRIGLFPSIPNKACFTFWDIGNSDGTAIWVIQNIGNEWRCVKFGEWWGDPYSTMVKWLQDTGFIWSTMYLPHDADHVRQGQTINKSPKQMLEELMPGVRFEIVPRIEDISWGINQTRDIFPLLTMDKVECAEGIAHLDSYRYRWNERQQVWSTEPDKSGGHSEAADGLRQLGQAYAAGLINISTPITRKKAAARRTWRTV